MGATTQQHYPLEDFPLLDKLAHQPAKVQVSNVALPTLDKFQASIPADLDAKSIAKEWLNTFAAAVDKQDTPGISELLLGDAFWRDMLALTWEFRTFYTLKTIIKFLYMNLADAGFSKLVLRLDSVVLQEVGPDLAWIQGIFDFETNVGIGLGIFRLVPTSTGQWKAHTVYTNLEALKGFPERSGSLRDPVPNHGMWLEKRRRELNFEDVEPAVIVVGAGQGGLDVAARLRLLDVPTLVIEKQARVGDQWRGRYEALCLHDPIWYDHMPYVPFPSSWPLWTPAPKLADWLESYAHIMELNVWTSCMVENIQEIPGEGWSVSVKRSDGTARTFTPRHIVFAHGGTMNMPKYPGTEEFGGNIMHSTQYKSARDHIGKKVVVIGACSSGHDIAHDHYSHGVDITVYQRGPSYVMSNKHGMPILMRGLYWQEPMPTDIADRVSASFPINFLRLLHRRVANEIAVADKELLEGLKAKGFRLTFGKDNSGPLVQAWERGGGHYLDVGTSQLIIDGKIKLKNDSIISHFVKDGLVFEDGSKLSADVVIFATGYGDPKDLVTKLAGVEVSSRVRQVWGLNAEGELNTRWRFSGVDGLYLMSGNLAQCRFHSRHLALQIKAKEEGVYGRRYEE